MNKEKHKASRQFIQALPHARELGMELTDAGEGMAQISMPYDARFIGDPETGVIHGGAVSALMDTCCGVAAVNHPKSSGSTATLDLRIDYMRPATPGQSIVTKAECYHITRSVAFVRAQAFDDNADHPVASATGAFTVGRKK